MSRTTNILNMGIVRADISQLKTTTNATNEKLSQTIKRIDTIDESNVGQMKQELAEVKQTVSTIDSTYSKKSEVSAIDSRVGAVETSLQNLDNDYAKDADVDLKIDAKASEITEAYTAADSALDQRINTLNSTTVDHGSRIVAVEESLQNLDTNYATDADVDKKIRESISPLTTDIAEEKVRKDKIEEALSRVPTYAPGSSEDTTSPVVVPDVTYSTDTPLSQDEVEGLAFNGVSLKPTIVGEKDTVLSLTTSFGGISIDKEASPELSEEGIDHRWVIERNTNAQLKFHMNDQTNTPLAIDQAGIVTPRITLNSHPIVDVVTTKITAENSKSNTIPSTKAIVEYINANVAKKALAQSDGVTVSEESPGTRDIEVNELSEAKVNSTIDTIDVDGKQSVLVKNASALSFNIEPTVPHTSKPRMVTIHPSINDGIKVDNKFKLSNDDGILCALVNATQETLPSAESGIPNMNIVGKYVEFTGNVINIDDMYILEVRIPVEVSATICGVVGKDLTSNNQTTFTHNNAIHELPSKDANGVPLHFITVFNSGIHLIQTESGSYSKGSLLAPAKYGVARAANDKLISFCTSYRIPLGKVIANDCDYIVAMII